MHPKLPDEAQHARVVPGLSKSLLFSIGQAYNEGWYAVFSESHLHIIRDGQIVITGYCNKKEGLWDIPLHSSPSPQHTCARQVLNTIVNKKQSKTALEKYLHG